MRRTVTAIALGLAWLTCLGTASRAVSPVPAVPSPVTAWRAPAGPAAEATQSRTSLAPSAFLDTYCVACHNDRVRAAGLSFNPAALGDPAANPELWEKVLQKVRTGQMPPAGRPRPDAAALAGVLTTVADSLDRAAAATPDPGRVGVHRLNRTEYRNAIRDLLSLQVDAATLLLPDEADEGFDNVAASLALSPSHLERYLAAAREISRQAVGDLTLGQVPASITYRVPKLLEQDVRLGDDLPFGSRGGFAVRHDFPLDGEYGFKVRLRRQVYDYIVGMGQAQELDLRIDGVPHQAVHRRRRSDRDAGAADVERRDRRRHAVGALHARGRRGPGGADRGYRRVRTW